MIKSTLIESLGDFISDNEKKVGKYLSDSGKKILNYGYDKTLKKPVDRYHQLENSLEAKGKHYGGKAGKVIGNIAERIKPSPSPSLSPGFPSPGLKISKGIRGEEIGSRVLGKAGKYTPRGGLAGLVATGAYLGGDAVADHMNKSADIANKAAQQAADSKIRAAHAANMAKHAANNSKVSEEKETNSDEPKPSEEKENNNSSDDSLSSNNTKRNALIAGGIGAAGISALALRRRKRFR
jgi:hypothetical protein